MSNNETSKMYGRWEVLCAESVIGDNHAVTYKCRCVCGTEKWVKRASLCNGKSKSCGCLHKEIVGNRTRKEDGRHQNKLTLLSWQAMLSRCKNQKNIGYKDYGGRGITYDPRWEHFENFLEDMGARTSGKTLERINNNLNYSKENCKWETRPVQSFNQRLNKNNKTGVAGIRMKNGCWSVNIRKDNKRIYLGTFEKFIDACEVRALEELELYGFCKINIKRY